MIICMSMKSEGSMYIPHHLHTAPSMPTQRPRTCEHGWSHAKRVALGCVYGRTA